MRTILPIALLALTGCHWMFGHAPPAADRHAVTDRVAEVSQVSDGTPAPVDRHGPVLDRLSPADARVADGPLPADSQLSPEAAPPPTCPPTHECVPSEVAGGNAVQLLVLAHNATPPACALVGAPYHQSFSNAGICGCIFDSSKVPGSCCDLGAECSLDPTCKGDVFVWALAAGCQPFAQQGFCTLKKPTCGCNPKIIWPAPWADDVYACAIPSFTSLPGCQAGQACVPKLTSGKRCAPSVSTAGCPSGLVASTVYTGFQETRSCSCAATGSLGCAGGHSLHCGPGCVSTSLATLSVGVCAKVPDSNTCPTGIYSQKKTLNPLCVGMDSIGNTLGSITPTGETTFCCQP